MVATYTAKKISSLCSGKIAYKITGPISEFATDALIFAGQSNQVGQGALALNPTYYNSIQNFALDDTVKAFDDPYHDTTDTVYGTVFDNSSPKIGAAGFVADYIMANTGRQIMTVPAAKGGTGFDVGDWSPDGAHEQGLIERINKAKAFSNIKAICWHQGEDDADEGVTTQEYEDYFAAFKSRVEAATGFNGKWFVTKLHQWDAGISGISEAAWNAIQDAQDNIAATYSDVFLVDMSDTLGASGDRIHLDNDGQRTKATREAKLILQEVYGIANPDMAFANGAAIYMDFENDDLTTSGTDVTGITPSINNSDLLTVGISDQYPQLVTGINSRRALEATNGDEFVRYEYDAGDAQTVFLLGTLYEQSVGNYVFSLGSSSGGSTTRALTMNGADNFFIRNDAGGAQSLINPVTDGTDVVICLRWNGTTSLEGFVNSTTALFDIDPEDITTFDYAWLFARDSSGAGTAAVAGTQSAVHAHYTRALTDAEVTNIITDLAARGGITLS